MEDIDGIGQVSKEAAGFVEVGRLVIVSAEYQEERKNNCGDDEQVENGGLHRHGGNGHKNRRESDKEPAEILGQAFLRRKRATPKKKEKTTQKMTPR